MLLVGGDKRDNRTEWYREVIPVAERLGSATSTSYSGKEDPVPNTRPWEELEAELRQPGEEEAMAAARARLAAEDATYLRRLADLRRARQLTQVELSRRLGVAQPSLSKVERQADLYVSTLRRCIEAMGGRLEIHAVFPDLDYELRYEDFEQIDHDNPELDDEAGLAEAL